MSIAATRLPTSTTSASVKFRTVKNANRLMFIRYPLVKKVGDSSPPSRLPADPRKIIRHVHRTLFQLRALPEPRSR